MASREESIGRVGTLDDVMRAPAMPPDVVVLNSAPGLGRRKEMLDPREDLWLTTADGRYSTPIIPIRVGKTPNIETFYVHKHILLKAEWFRKALCGGFMEAEKQELVLEEDDPAIFHFIVAFLYEEKYSPIQPISTVLVPSVAKGKANAASLDATDSESDSNIEDVLSDSSGVSQRRREQFQRRRERVVERTSQKRPGNTHRPNCNCPQCTPNYGQPCWNCGTAPRTQNMAWHVGNAQPPIRGQYNGQRTQPARGPLRGAPIAPGTAIPASGRLVTGGPGGAEGPDPNGDRIKGEDLRTWLLAYELTVDVYITADKFLLGDFKSAVARACVDMLETAGSDAAHPAVLRLCRRLYEGLPAGDPLLAMVLARVGFLQPVLWRRAPAETADFLVGCPDVAALMLRETTMRREDELGGRDLPSMERAWAAGPPPPRLQPPQVAMPMIGQLGANYRGHPAHQIW